jgi:hypothetical protein
MSDDSPRQPDSTPRPGRERYSRHDFGDDPLTNTGPMDPVSEPVGPAQPAEGTVGRGTEPLLDEPLGGRTPSAGAQESLFDEISAPLDRPVLPPPHRPAREHAAAERRRASDDDEPYDRRPLIAVAAVVAVLVVVAIVVAVVGGGSGGSGGDQAGGKSGGPVFAGASTTGSPTHPATSASPTATATATGPSATASAPVSTVAPKDVPLTVLNNTTVTGLATDAAKEFAGRGWDIGMIGNYTGDIATTTVYYAASDTKQEQAAQTLAAQFPKVAKVAPRLADLPGSGLTVVIAPDWKN